MLYLFDNNGINIGIFWYDSTNEYGKRYLHFAFNPDFGWGWSYIDDFEYWLSDCLIEHDGWNSDVPYTVYWQE